MSKRGNLSNPEAAMRTLLETLQQRLGCLYLSDLHTDDFRPWALREALRVPPEDYPLEQWQETFRYLVGGVPSMATAEELRALLAQCATGF